MVALSRRRPRPLVMATQTRMIRTISGWTSELLEAAAVEQARIAARRSRAERPTNASVRAKRPMAMTPQAPTTPCTRDRTDRIVDPDLVEEQHGEHDEHAADGTDDSRHRVVERTAPGRDRNEAGEDTVADERDVRLAGLRPDHDGRGGGTRRCGEHRVERDTGDLEVCEQFRAGVEAEPADQRMNTPSMANGMLWPGMARGLPSGPYLPMRGPRNSGAHEGGDTAGHVHDARPGEVGEDGIADSISAMIPPPHVMWTTTG